MKRRTFMKLFAGVAVGWPLTTVAQDTGRIRRLGMLMPFPREALRIPTKSPGHSEMMSPGIPT